MSQDEKMMSPEELLECFASQSKLFKYSDLTTKIEILKSYFSKDGYRNTNLFSYRNNIWLNHNLKIREDEFIIACAVYLDLSFVHGVLIHPMEKIVSDYNASFRAMKDGRNKVNQLLNGKHINTRSIFDIGGTEGNSTNFEEKRRVLQKLYDEVNIFPSQLLFYHINSYRSQPNGGKNYMHVLQEAPYSAFAICYSDTNFILPNIKEYYNQSSNKAKLIQLDFANYIVELK
ncbi:hypothetical protein [Leptospira sp. GIMC2001]|uniref:hypothetical protein n=1 Tax=Leptospira sp. GIMC2001 TaxID=1513297 RepID=UPI002348F80C|nr:hypothetical protein [Leptospira sp. GIMC2001]WCL50737.1 hypothetical protein O4O04_07975 [Leptospira sp. GIMC2001]